MEKNDNFPERIEFVIDKLNGPSEFARKTGVTLSTITRWRKGEAEPSRPNLVKIAEVANVDLEWLATGRNETKTAETPTALTKTAINLYDELDQDYDYIDDYRTIGVSAGFGTYNADQPPAYTKIERQWLQTRGLKADNCAMFTVTGDSMHPTLKDGEEIIVDRSKTELREGKIFVLNHQGTMWVKKVQLGFNGIELLSDNQAYRPIILNADEANGLIIIGQLVRSYRDF